MIQDRLHPYGIIDPCKIQDKADKVLDDFFEVGEKAGVTPFLFYGTCLGFIRDGGYIEDDNDLDVGIIGELQEVADALIQKGFIPKNRYPRHAHFIRDNVLLDIFFGFFGWQLPYISRFIEVVYKGKRYRIPHNAEGYLKAEYGHTWKKRIPRDK